MAKRKPAAIKTKKKAPPNKLRFERGWSDHYYIGKREVADLQEVEIRGKRYPVTARSECETYYDHGHTYTGCSCHYYVKTQVFGLQQEIDLNTIVARTDVIATKFELRGE
jgi:hypothetical protein